MKAYVDMDHNELLSLKASLEVITIYGPYSQL